MANKNIKYSLRGFTIVELLVTLALTSLAITFSYSTLTYIQKLLYNYQKQNKFINEYTELIKRFDYESIFSTSVVEGSENRFLIKRDSTESILEIFDRTIVFKKGTLCDTFHISAKKIVKEYEFMKNPKWTNKLLKYMEFETDFSKQKFIVYFYKNYDSAIKLELEKEE